MIACPKCGFDNELGRIFCHQCGTKLDLNQVKPPSQGGPKIRRRRKWTPGSIVTRIVEVIVLAGLVWVIFLMSQVPDVKPIKSTNADLLGADNKRLELDQLVIHEKPGTIEVTEAELNAFIGSLSFGKPKGAGLEFVPASFQTKLDNGTVELIYVGDIKIGTAFTKRLYLNFTGVPVVEEHYFEFRPVAAYVGQLPIHPRLLDVTSFIQNAFGRILIKLDHERELLEKLNSITVKSGKAVLTYQPPQPAAGTSGKASAR
jgi:hypothetical protein